MKNFKMPVKRIHCLFVKGFKNFPKDKRLHYLIRKLLNSIAVEVTIAVAFTLLFH